MKTNRFPNIIHNSHRGVYSRQRRQLGHLSEAVKEAHETVNHGSKYTTVQENLWKNENIEYFNAAGISMYFFNTRHRHHAVLYNMSFPDANL